MVLSHVEDFPVLNGKPIRSSPTSQRISATLHGSIHVYSVKTKSGLNIVTGDNRLLVTMNNNPSGWGGVVAAMLGED